MCYFCCTHCTTPQTSNPQSLPHFDSNSFCASAVCVRVWWRGCVPDVLVQSTCYWPSNAQTRMVPLASLLNGVRHRPWHCHCRFSHYTVFSLCQRVCASTHNRKKYISFYAFLLLLLNCSHREYWYRSLKWIDTSFIANPNKNSPYTVSARSRIDRCRCTFELLRS